MQSYQRIQWTNTSYLEGTNHIDPDDGFLYEVTKVEEKTFRGQGRYIVAHHAQVLSGGRLSTK